MVNNMYNPNNTLITSKEEQYEIPSAPTFRENPMDAIFRIFQENGTGDPSPDWLQPSTSVESTPQQVQPKLCPFRKRIHFRNDKDPYDVALNFANHMEEEFQPCLREQCAVWIERMGACTY